MREFKVINYIFFCHGPLHTSVLMTTWIIFRTLLHIFFHLNCFLWNSRNMNLCDRCDRLNLSGVFLNQTFPNNFMFNLPLVQKRFKSISKPYIYRSFCSGRIHIHYCCSWQELKCFSGFLCTQVCFFSPNVWGTLPTVLLGSCQRLLQ